MIVRGRPTAPAMSRDRRLDGTWERVFTALVAQADADEDVSWAVSVDSTIVRAHQHAAGARKKGPRPESRTITPSAGPAAD